MSEQQGFFSAHCEVCQRSVLGRRALAESDTDELLWLCLHCDAPLDASSARWLEASALDEVHCFIIDEQGGDDKKHGEHGGCRDGACGIRQPAVRS